MTLPNNSDGPQSGSVAQDQLQSFVRRIEALEDEITALNGDKSEVYKDAKGNGFDTKVLRKVIADRRKDATERNEFDAVYQLYWDAIHGVVRAHVENIEEFDPETGEVLTETPVSHAPVQPGREEPGTTDGAASAGETAQNISSQAVTSVRSFGGDGSATSSAGMEGEADRQPIHSSTAALKEAHPFPSADSSTDRRDHHAEEPTHAVMHPQREARPEEGAGTQAPPVDTHSDAHAVPAAPHKPGDTWTEHTPSEPLRWHEYARCFPEHWAMSLANIKDSIREEGVREPIVRIGNEILDGRARYNCARELLIDYPVTEYAGTDPLLDVIRWNLEARQMGANERKLVATKLAKLCPDRGEEIAAAFGLDHGRAAAE